jgi:D-alanyl-D-alanine endopeptidase (penicillin-binding protein 7)
MSPVTSGARWRRTFALATGLLLLQFPLQSAAADRSPARKAVPSKSAPQAAASKKVVAAPTVRKGTLPQSVSPTTVRKQAAVEQGGRPAKALKTPLRAERAARNGKLVRASYAPRAIEPPRLSIGNAIGLHLVDDPLDLRSSVAMVIDQQTGETLYEKNPDAVLPIASIT